MRASRACRALGNARLAVRGEPLTVFGDGSQTRSFCYVDDLCDGIWRLLQSHETLPVNLGNSDEITMEQFAHEVLKVTGSKSQIVHRELPEDDPKVRQPDIGRAQELLGWEPHVSLEDGLRRTLEYFREKLSREG